MEPNTPPSESKTIVVDPLVASTFRSDGGTIFGPVPKVLWSRAVKPDERNTIAQHANVVRLTLPDGTHGLIDAGCGDPDALPPKTRRHSGIGDGWPLMEALAKRGIAAEDIGFVIMTHLHWDHCGGLLRADGSLTFPNATLYVDLHEMMDAEKENPLLYQAYPVPLVHAIATQMTVKRKLHKAHQVSSTIFPGIELIRTGGHTQHHCMVMIDVGEGKALTLANDSNSWPDDAPVRRVAVVGDAIPTRHHLHPAWQTGYDTMPLDTRAWKRNWLPQLARENTVVLFGHDVEGYGGRLEMVDERAILVQEWQKFC